MTVLIDSNMVIGFLKNDITIVSKIDDYVSNKIPIFISSISIYEVYYGIIANLYLKGGKPGKVPELLEIYKKFISKCGVLNFNKEAAESAADIYAKSQSKGEAIKEKDCQIAAIALTHGISEVFTQDIKDFSKINELTGLKHVNTQ